MDTRAPRANTWIEKKAFQIGLEGNQFVRATSAYRIFKSFGGRFRTALPTSLIFDCCGRLKTLGRADIGLPPADVRFTPKADIAERD
jgi:hypothetical protein